MIPLNILVFDRGVAGVPGTSYITDLAGVTDNAQWMIGAGVGFESMTVAFAANVDEALDWLNNGLMRSVIVVSPDDETCWEGLLETIEVDFGGERRSASLRDMFNRVRVRYQTVLGTQGARPTASTFFQDAASMALYGKKDLVLAVGNTSDGAEVDNYGTTMLARKSNPTSGPSSTIQTSETGSVQMTLTFAGWGTTLDWAVTSNTSTTKSSTTTQIGTLLTALAAINNFISTSTAHITPSGVTATEFTEPDTTYRAKIDALMARGNGTQPYAYGVYEDRMFAAAQYAGATPDVIQYQAHLGGDTLYDAQEGEVKLWNARPDRMYQTVELLDVAPVATAKDSAARFYVARVTFSISADAMSLSLEPEESSDLAAVMITKYL